MTELQIIRRKQRWFTWRDVVSVLLGVGVLALVVQVGQLRHELAGRPTSAQVAALTRQVGDLSRQLAAKDARIRQLTDVLIRNRIAVPLEPTPTPSPQVSSSPPALTPPPGVSPRPTPGRTSQPRPRPTRHPKPHPSPSCLTTVAGRCVSPPPVPTPLI